ncbi:hypothetical protein G9A89_016029 [Geosiphon pyriformis]|nr:hypothetical protein G9A89_016029 [Geosiphon pyriformis]
MVSDNNANSEVTTVTQRSTSVETIVSEYQVEGKITSAAKGEDINTNPHSSLTVEIARPITPPFRFETTNRPFGSVNTSSRDNTPFRIAKTSKKTAPHRRAADFSSITANKLEEKANKKYRHIGGLSIKRLTEKFTQISEENLPKTTFGASKFLRKIDEPSKVPKEDRNRAAQIKAALRKCNPDILDRINRRKSTLENEKQMDDPFDANRDKPNAEDVAENMEESESSLSSKMASPSPGQYSSKSLGKKPMSVEANPEEGWHVLFVQALNIPEKIMGKKVGWIYDLLEDVNYLLGAVMARNQEIRVNFSQVAGRDQARKILADNDIELFLMATDSVNIQMAEVRAAIKEFGEQSAVVEYSNQEKATKAVDQWSTMVRKDVVRIYLMIGTQKIIEQRKTWEAKLMSCAYVGFDSEANCNNATKKPLVIGDTLVHWMPTDAKECHFCYQVGHLVSICPTLHKKKEGDTKKVTNNIRLAKLYVKRNVSEENIKAFGRRSYADMAALRLSQVNNREEQSKKGGNQPWKSEINELKQQINEMAKLLNAVAAKLGVTLEKGEKVIVTQQPSDTSEEKEVVEMELPSQSTILKSNPVEKKEVYNPELEIKEIKKTLEPILELLKQNRTTSITTLEKLVLWWVIEEQFDFVIVTETKITPTKKKCVFFGSDEYHAFWESSTEKQMGTGVGIVTG